MVTAAFARRVGSFSTNSRDTCSRGDIDCPTSCTRFGDVLLDLSLMASRMAVAHPLPLTAIMMSHCSSVSSIRSRKAHQTAALLMNMSILENIWDGSIYMQSISMNQAGDHVQHTLIANSIKANISAVLLISHF